jgi:hypothetical protein
MNPSNLDASSGTPSMTNGSGAAAILSAGVGAFALAVLAIAADKSAQIARSLIFYKPTGPLPGVTTAAILIWLFTWGIFWNGAGATKQSPPGVSMLLR